MSLRSCGLWADLPDVMIFRNHVNPSFGKYFSFPEMQISRMVCHPAPARGALRDRHGRWARDAMDALTSPDE
jgi:hypothetical protein